MGRTAPPMPTGEKVKTSHRLITVHEPDWIRFQKKYGVGNVSARIRELVREDLERG